MTPTPTHSTDLRELALERLKKKSEFKVHLLTYVLVNAAVVVIWLVAGGPFFWPLIPILGWGIGLVFHGWDAYRWPNPSEERIRREIDSLERGGAR